MANYVTVIVKTNDNLDFTKEIKKIIDKAEFYDEAKEAGGSITFFTRERDLKTLMDEILDVTKNYSTEEFKLELSYEHNDYTTTDIFKAQKGEYDLYKKEISYIEAQDNKQILDLPEEAQPLLDEAIECFRKLDVDKDGQPEHSPHKHTIELEGENYKIMVSKKGAVYGVDKILQKVATYNWEEFSLPF